MKYEMSNHSKSQDITNDQSKKCIKYILQKVFNCQKLNTHRWSIYPAIRYIL